MSSALISFIYTCFTCIIIVLMFTMKAEVIYVGGEVFIL